MRARLFDAVAFLILFSLALFVLHVGSAHSEPNEDHETLSPVSCEDHNFDVRKIASAVKQGITKENLFLHLGKGTGLEIARIEAIRILIDDAYRNADALTAWYHNHLWVCSEM